MAKPIIAVFNSSDDTVEMLRTALEAEGLHTVPGHIGELKKGELDISLPYDTNETEALEIIGKPDDPERAVTAVQAALGQAR